MFPGVNGNQWGVLTTNGVLVSSLDNLNGTVLVVLNDPGPTGTLDAGQARVGEGDQLVKGAVLSDDSLGESTGWQFTTTLLVWGQVLPEQVVVSETTTVEVDGFLQLNGLQDITSVGGLGMLFKSSVVTVDVSLMVLLVVQLVDLARDVWLKGGVVEIQVWQGDLGSDEHWGSDGLCTEGADSEHCVLERVAIGSVNWWQSVVAVARKKHSEGGKVSFLNVRGIDWMACSHRPGHNSENGPLRKQLKATMLIPLTLAFAYYTAWVFLLVSVSLCPLLLGYVTNYISPFWKRNGSTSAFRLRRGQ